MISSGFGAPGGLYESYMRIMRDRRLARLGGIWGFEALVLEHGVEARG